MTQRTCAVNGCDTPAKCRGWCRRHYGRWRIYGSPTGNSGRRLGGVCKVSGCESSVKSWGWCQAHYVRWRKHGSPTGGKVWCDDTARFWSKVTEGSPPECDVALGPCWPWGGNRSPDGYGRFPIRSGVGTQKVYLAHRWAYMLLIGDIPDGLELDHLCRTPACVNPYHLDPVTGGVNRNRTRGRRAPKTHCPHGHLYDDMNTYYGSDGYRGCKACRSISNHRQVERRAALRAL